MTCPRCNDTGLIEYTGGEHVSYGNTVTSSQRIEATPENPVYKQCSCRHTRKADEPKEAAVYE